MKLLEAIKLAKLATKEIPNLKFESQGGKVCVTGFKRSYSITARAECASEINCIVDASKVYGAVQKFGDNIEQKDGQLKFKQGRSRASIPSVESQFPDPMTQSDNRVNIDGVFSKLISTVAFAAAKDDARAFLNGILIEIKNDSISVVASDGKRIAWIEQESEFDNEISFIMPQDAISALQSVGPSLLEIGYITKGIGQDAEISIASIAGKYANWRAVIPEFKSSMVIDKAVILDALQKISIVSVDKMQKGIIQIGNGSIVLSSTMPDGSAAEAWIDADINDEMEIGINVKYMEESISAMRGDKITISYTDEKTGVGFTDSELSVVVMPVVK